MSSHRLYNDRVIVTFQELRHTYTVRIPAAGIQRMWFPSCSGILGIRNKPALINWACGQVHEYASRKLKALTTDTIAVQEAENILAESLECWRDLSKATTIGSLAHRYLHAHLAHIAGVTSEQPNRTQLADPILQPDVTQEMLDAANQSIDAGLQFLDEHHVEPIMFERVLFSPTHSFLGTADLFAKVDGVLSCLDWKTSKSIYPENHLQTSGYCCAFMEEFPDKVVQDRWVVNIKKDGGLEYEKRDLSTYSEDLNAFLSCLEVYKWDRVNDKYRPGSAIQVLGPLDQLIEQAKKTQ